MSAKTQAPQPHARSASQPRATAAAPEAPPADHVAGRFWPLLTAIIGVAALGRLILRWDFFAHCPFALYPLADAREYWEWAGRIAGGRLVDNVPFLSAPLYPYIVALFRAAGGGLGALVLAQCLMDLGSAVLLALLGRWRFNATVGLLAAALYLLLIEPAGFSTRILAVSIQPPLICLAWLAMAAALERPTLWRGLLAGAALGLYTLTYPPAVVAGPVFAVAWWLGMGRNLKAAGRAAWVLAGLALVIAPATVHNYLACREFIPISAQGGITFAHGNAPLAAGVYIPYPGVSLDREKQNADAARVYEQATGRKATWNDVSRYFFQQGLKFWRENPGAAGMLLLRKCWWFLTGRFYSDIYFFPYERREGVLRALWLTPIATAWILPASIVALVAWLVWQPRRYWPESLLFAVPFLVVVTFWYSPRYRFPVVPVAVVGCAWLLWRAWASRRQLAWPTVAGLALLLGIGTGWSNARLGFDVDAAKPADMWNKAGAALMSAGQTERSIAALRKALDQDPGRSKTALDLSRQLRHVGRPAEAERYLREALLRKPSDVSLALEMGEVCLALQRPDEALLVYTRVVQLDPQQFEAYLRIFMLQYERQACRAARQAAEAALRLRPNEPAVLNNLAWLLATTPGTTPDEHARALALAEQASAAAGGKDPSRISTVAAALAANGRFDEAIAEVQRGLQLLEANAREDLRTNLQEQLMRYQAGQPSIGECNGS